MNSGLQWDREGRGWPHRDASRFVHVDGLRWHVQVMGQGPAVLLIHGTGASSHSWRGLTPLLTHRYTVVVPDLPGHAFTEAASNRSCSLPSMANDLAALVRTLGLEISLCLGHSAGAAIALRMVLNDLISPRRLLAVNGAFLPLQGLPGLVMPLAARAMAVTGFAPWLFARRASEPGTVERLIAGTGSTLDDEGTALYAMLMGDARHAAGALNMMAQWDLRPLMRDLARLRTPLGLMVGMNDRAVPPREAHRVLALLPRTTPSSILSLPGVGHLAHEERPDAVAHWMSQQASQSTPAVS